MPHFVTFDNFTATPNIQAGGNENGYRLKDVIITSFDNNNSTFYPSNQFESKAIVHSSFQPETDGFMKLGDIRGEFANKTTEVKFGVIDTPEFEDALTKGGQEGEEARGGFGELPVVKQQSNWDVICDVGTSIKQARVVDALSNRGPEVYAEVEWTYLKNDVWTNGSATSIHDEITCPHLNDNVEMMGGAQNIQDQALQLDKSSTKYNPVKGASSAPEQAEGWIIIESIVNQDNIQGLDAGTINDQQVELCSGTSLGCEFLDSPITGGQVKNKQQEY